MPNFPHMKENEFPHLDNVNVYKYENDLDYSRYDYTQMKLTICTVPWDMGEAHVGQRTISGIGNVVAFEDAAARDQWFTTIPDSECVRIETKFKELHRDNEIVVPLPFDIACKYNYLTVEYSLFANDGSPLEYEHAGGVRKWFWFIREVEFVAPNATRLHLLNDAWQTFIYDVDIPYMILERGHAPLFAMDADTYLSNPIDNSDLLLEPDANLENTAYTFNHSAEKVFDVGSMYVCFVTSAAVQHNWGTVHSNSWKTAGGHWLGEDGIPTYRIFAVHTENFSDFMREIDENVPQFKQTVKACFLCAAELLTIGTEFHFTGIPDIPCYRIQAHKHVNEPFISLDKETFAYPAEYADLAKLYTYPYAYIEVTDENGNSQQIRIEECQPNVNVSFMLNTAFPALNLQAYLTGVGAFASHTVEFRNFDPKTMLINGKWYELQWAWNVPTFGVFLSPDTEYDYSGYFDREQKRIEYTARYDNAIASIDRTYDNATDSNATNKSNADASAETSQGNAKRTAKSVYDNAVDNADTDYYATRAMNAQGSANKHAESYAMANQLFEGAKKTGRDVGKDNEYIAAGIASQADKVVITSVTNSIGSVARGAAGGAAIGGPAGAAVGAATGAISAAGSTAASILSWGVDNAMAANQQAVNESKANNSYKLNQWQSIYIYGTDFTASGVGSGFSGNIGSFGGGLNYQLLHDTAAMENYNKANIRKTIKGGTVDARTINSGTPTGYSSLDFSEPARSLTGTAVRSKKAADDNADDTATTTKSNAEATKTTDDANALRTKNTDTANAGRNLATDQSAVENRTRQEGLKPVYEYGEFANRENQNTKPKMLLANIVTENRAGIKYAGDTFLRYGYALNRQWEFDGNWNVGKYFTYWKLSDFWVKGLNVPDLYMDKLRFFLFGGVTIWRRPEDIGHVSIYENWN